MSNLDKYELNIIQYAYDSWFEAVVSHAPHKEVAHKAKRFKYLIDWTTEVFEMQERKANEPDSLNLIA